MFETPKYKDNKIVQLSFSFAVNTTLFCDSLVAVRRFDLSRQLFRSATSIGANIREAQNSESQRDFIHKMKISLKEVDETEFWLLLCRELPDTQDTSGLLEGLKSIRMILNKIISTKKNNLKNQGTKNQ